MFLIVSQAELDQITADTAAGTGQAGSLGVMYQVRETGLVYVWDSASREIVPAGGLNASQVGALTPKNPILSGASAGDNSGAQLIGPFPERLVWQLDSGTTSTGFTIDILAADGVTSLGQAFTGTYASSTVAEFSPPLMFTNPLARYFRVTVTSGGPLTMHRCA